MNKTRISQKHVAETKSGLEISSPADRQKLFRRSIKLLPMLARRGVSPCDAIAVAFNAAFLYYNMPHSKFMLSPKAILRKYSYGEIASLCEYLTGAADYAVNESFKGVLP